MKSAGYEKAQWCTGALSTCACVRACELERIDIVNTLYVTISIYKHTMTDQQTVACGVVCWQLIGCVRTYVRMWACQTNSWRRRGSRLQQSLVQSASIVLTANPALAISQC